MFNLLSIARCKAFVRENGPIIDEIEFISDQPVDVRQWLLHGEGCVVYANVLNVDINDALNEAQINVEHGIEECRRFLDYCLDLS